MIKNKIKVSLEVGKVLDEYLGCFDATLVDLVKRQCNGKLRTDETALYELNPIILSLAIVNGHEVELTPKEKWEARYKELINSKYKPENDGDSADYSRVYAELRTIVDINNDFNLGLILEEEWNGL